MGALALNVFNGQKCGSSLFKCSKVWEPYYKSGQKCGSSRFKRSKRMGALALKAQKDGSSRFKHSKVIKGVGALALNAQNVWELPP